MVILDKILASRANESIQFVKDQFKINPKLQRTQATGNRQGTTIMTEAANPDLIIQKGVVRLPNRAVPLIVKKNSRRAPNLTPNQVFKSRTRTTIGDPNKRA